MNINTTKYRLTLERLWKNNIEFLGNNVKIDHYEYKNCLCWKIKRKIF